MGNTVINAIAAASATALTDLTTVVAASVPVVLGAVAVIAGGLRLGPRIVKRVFRG
jgi:hypothetical protein